MAVCVGATDFIGGGTGALDAYDGAAFSAGDASTVFKNGQFISYIFTSSSLPENSPWVIQPDTNGTGVRWIAVVDSNLNTIRSNLTLYCTTGGSDTTGDGTASYPWATLNKAISWLGDKKILPDVTVTINFAAGTFVHSSTVTIDGPQYRRVVIDGAGSSSTTLSFVAAGVGGILIANGTTLGGLRDVKLLGDGTNGNGVEITDRSTLIVTNDVVVDSFNIGIYALYGSFLRADSGSLTCSNNNNQGCYLIYSSEGFVTSCIFNNNGTSGLYCHQNAVCYAVSATANNNGTYGFATAFNSHINANSSTATGNGTAGYLPAKTTAGDPTFSSQGSWIYG